MTADLAETERPISDFPLWERAEQLAGNLVYAVSEESGLRVGVLQWPRHHLIGGSCLSLVRGHDAHSINIANLTHLELLVREDGYGDGTSHGATWEHVLQLLREMAESRGTTAERAIDACINIVAEGMVRHQGCWAHMLNQLFWLRDHPGHVGLRSNGLINLALIQAELNYRTSLATLEDTPIPPRTWEQPCWLEGWLDRFFHELLLEEQTAI